MIQFAFRNMQRNKKRSLLSIIAIFIAALIVMVSEAWIGGMYNAYLNGAARLQTGHIRVMSSGFHKRERFLPVDELIPAAAALKKRIRNIHGVTAVEERLRFGILLGKGPRSFPAVGMGIEFGKSRLGIREKLVRKHGSGEFRPDGLYPGKKLAAKLHAKSGDSLLLAAKTSWGGLNGIKATVGRPLTTGSDKLDRNAFFIDIRKARKLLKTGKSATEIYVYLQNYAMADRVAKKINRILPQGIKAYTLAQQNPAFYDYLSSVKSFMILIDSFIFFLASFVIINTMMMAIFERTREIGTLKALGMKESRIIASLGLEGAFMGAIGSTAGSVLGWVIISIVSRIGIDLSSQMEGIDMPIEYIIRPMVNPGVLLITISLAVGIAALAAVIPAWRIRKITAAEALRSV